MTTLVGGVLRKPITLIDGSVLPEGTLIVDARKMFMRSITLVSYLRGSEVITSLAKHEVNVCDVDWESFPV